MYTTTLSSVEAVRHVEAELAVQRSTAPVVVELSPVVRVKNFITTHTTPLGLKINGTLLVVIAVLAVAITGVEVFTDAATPSTVVVEGSVVVGGEN